MPEPLIHHHEPPRQPLAQLPTPLVACARLAPAAWIKRDDLTGLETTGNKIRKLEYVVADSMSQGANTLVTHGGHQSNHCRATAAIAARLGLHCRVILRGAADSPNDGNLLLDRLFGAEITLHPPDVYAHDLQKLIDRAMADERAAGRKPYFFPVGASIPLGCWGYIRCFHEILQQTQGHPAVDLFAPVSSSGTIAGLILGKALFQADHVRVLGIPVSDSIEFFRQDIRKLLDDTIREYRLELTAAQTAIELVEGYIGDGYAIPTPQSIDVLKRVARSEGILLDPTYTAKAMVGFLDWINGGRIRPGAAPIFIHTGGIFGLMARRELFE
jgi:D-cysteine desulfhydrase